MQQQARYPARVTHLSLPAVNDRSAVAGRNSQAGFTLIETLAALVVLSVGLLGIAALHTHGISTG